MKISVPTAVLCLALCATDVSADELRRVRRGRRMIRGDYAPETAFMGDVAADQDAAFWERELGKKKSYGSKSSKGSSKSSSKSSNGYRVLAKDESPETAFMQEHEQEDIDFWNRELGKKKSYGSKSSKGSSKSSKGSSKSSKGY